MTFPRRENGNTESGDADIGKAETSAAAWMSILFTLPESDLTQSDAPGAQIAVALAGFAGAASTGSIPLRCGTWSARLGGVQIAIRSIFRRRHLLTKSERSFCAILRRAVRGQVVMAKVRLADLIDAHERHSYWQANFNRVFSKRVDFVVCDPLNRPVIAIELDDESHQRKDRRERDDVVDNLFATVRLPLLRVPVRHDYDVDELRLLLLQKLE